MVLDDSDDDENESNAEFLRSKPQQYRSERTKSM